MTDEPELEVFYDSACPLCRREIELYRRLDRAGRIRWVDLHADGGGAPACGIDRATALRRLHARDARRGSVSGARAFAAIWQRIDGLRWLGHLAARRPFVWVAEGAYRAFLHVRPGLTRLAARAERRRANPRPGGSA